VALVRTYVSEENIASFIRVKRIRELGAMSAVTSLLIIFTLIMEVINSSQTSDLTRATWHHIPEDGILARPMLRKIPRNARN
jgi:hypothetical protein